MSGHVALVCLCVLFVWSVSSTVLREDGDQPSAETEGQPWTRIDEKDSRPKLDARTEGVEEKLRLTEQLTACTARLEERKEGAEETRRLNAEQLAGVNSRLYEAQQKIITLSVTSLSHQKEAERLQAENLRLKQHVERLEKTKAQCDLEVTALTGDVVKPRVNEDELNGKLVIQTSDLQQEMLDQFIDSTKTMLKETSTKLKEDFVELKTFITKTVIQSASDSNVNSNTIIQDMNNVKQEVSKKSDDILKEISSGNTKLQERFARMTNERESMQKELQSEHGEMLKVIESAKKQAMVAAFGTSSLGLVWLEDQFYLFYKEIKLTWHAARDFCVSRGLSLASIESDEENRRVWDHMTKISMIDTWLGASDEAQEGTWRWNATGATLTYTNWYESQPNGGKWENCMVIYTNGTWWDIRCDSTRSFICELQN